MISNRRIYILLFVAIALSLVLVACGGAPQEQVQQPEEKKLKFAYVSPNPLGVNEFLIMGQTGMEVIAEKYDAETMLLESEFGDPTSAEANVRAAVDWGADLVFVLGFEFGDIIPEVAPEARLEEIARRARQGSSATSQGVQPARQIGADYRGLFTIERWLDNFFFLGLLFRVDLSLDPRIRHAHHLVGDPIGFLFILVVGLADLELGLHWRAARAAAPTGTYRFALQETKLYMILGTKSLRRVLTLWRSYLVFVQHLLIGLL